MGKYLIKVESMDMDEKLDERYQNGLECNGFVIMTDTGSGYDVALHCVSIDRISEIIVNNSQLMSAGILAKAKKEIVECSREGEMKRMLGDMLGMN